MDVLKSRIDTSTDTFRESLSRYRELEADLAAQLALVAKGGSERSVEPRLARAQ